ncbi:AbiJ-NTD4 domain-containing protein [Gemmatimonadota bacterium]
MNLFSEREGIHPKKLEMQENSIDQSLKLNIWNFIYLDIIKKIERFVRTGTLEGLILSRIWGLVLKRPLDEMPGRIDIFLPEFKSFFFSCQWYRIYDIIELIHSTMEEESSRQNSFSHTCNYILKEEMSAWRIIGNRVCKISSEEEKEAIEEALNLSNSIPSVKTHLEQALNLISDRKNPDYRNSIKESISGIESLCKIITGNKKATLSQALSQLDDASGVKIHKALRNSFESLYGYVSDAQGIRHGLDLLEEPNLDFDDAKFMLVSCSAFINFLILKASKANIDLAKS